MFRTLPVMVAVVVVLSLAAAHTWAGTFLKVDFNQAGSVDNEPGFQPFTLAPSGINPTESNIYATSEGNITVSATGATGNFFRNPPISDGGGLTLASVYNDFMYVNGGSFTISISGLVSGQQYRVKFYSWDHDGRTSNVVTRTLFTPASLLIGTTASIDYDHTVAPATDDTYATTAFWTAQAGSIDFTLTGLNVATSGGDLVRLNGLELFIPEPASASLLALGGLACLRRRRA